MPLDDTAVFIPSIGHYLTGATTATQPTQTQINTFISAGTLPTGLTELGHTDAEDIFAFGQDDGDSEVKPSWQNKSLREIVTAQAIDYFVAKAMQLLDNDVMSLYYGGGDATGTGMYKLPDSSTPQERSTLVVLSDGTNNAGFWVQRTSIRREDAIEFATDDFTKIPLRFTVLKKSGSPKAVWIHPDLGV